MRAPQLNLFILIVNVLLASFKGFAKFLNHHYSYKSVVERYQKADIVFKN